MDIAHKADPNAKLETEEGLRISQAHLRARILCQEALSWSLESLSKAATLAEHATLADPAFADAFHVLGALHYESRNRAAAIAALTKAHELDPDNIETCKLLDRTHNMGASEVATFKVTKAGLTAANTGIKVYNAGVHTRNVFVFFWNVFAAIINVITLPVRLMDRIFGTRR